MGFKVALLSLAGAVVCFSPASAAVLYEGTSGVTPNTPPWQWAYQTFNKVDPLFTPSAATQTSGAGYVTLDSSLESDDVAGYLTHLPNLFAPGDAYVMPDLPLLDRAAGFGVKFSVRLAAESHSSNDRAGFSVIVLTDDPAPLGIELGFWLDEIWAQTATFNHDPLVNVAFDTTAMVDYQLNVQGTNFELLADGTPILSGPLQDYSAFNGGPPGNPGFPYDRANLLFFGDNTSSASATIELAHISVVPEPAGAVLCGLAALSLSGMQFRRRARSLTVGPGRQ